MIVFVFELYNFQSVEVWLSDPNKGIWFNQQVSQYFTADTTTSSYTITVNDAVRYQEMDGFGASLTDATCWLLKYKLTSTKRKELLERLFSKNGIGISLLRQPIGASDFGWEAWSLDDTPGNIDDFNLNSFSLWREDDYIRPMLDEALNVNRERIKLFASPWSPPAWMKSQKHLFGGRGGYLRAECYSVYADYFVKFIKEYEKKGSTIYAITLQNEPLYAPQNYPGMLMSAENQIGFIKDFLGPKFRQAGIKTKIIAYDHNYDTEGYNFARAVLSNTSANAYCDGIGWHTYTSPQHQNMASIRNQFPDKGSWITEAGSGTWIGNTNAQFQDQMMHLIRSPRNWAKGVIFWNVALDQNAGPKLANVDTTNTNRGLITIRSDVMDSYTLESGYYSMAHSTKFVDPGSFRIDSNSFENDVENVAYINPDLSIVVVISNRTPNQRTIKIKWGNKALSYILPGSAAVTFKWSNSNPVKVIALRARANQKYVTVDSTNTLIASKTTIGIQEQFELFSIISDEVAFKSLSNRKYVCAENAGALPLVANRDAISGWEAFKLFPLPDGTYGFKSMANNKYVTADNFGNSPLLPSKNSIEGAWEAFDIIYISK